MLLLQLSIFITYSIGTNAIVPLKDFFAYGRQSGDQRLPNTYSFVEWTSSLSIELDPPFSMFGEPSTRIRINDRGVISVFLYQYRYEWTHGFHGHIYPFSTEVDLSKGGSVYYRKSSSGADLKKAQEEISSAFPAYQGVVLKWVVISTWDQVTISTLKYSNPASFNNDTYQAILSTDGNRTFVLFYYNQMDTTGWSEKHMEFATVGFQINDLHEYLVSGSDSENVSTIKDRSNADSPGKWIFRIDQPTIYEPSSVCAIPPQPENGFCIAQEFTAESLAKCSCKDGYQMDRLDAQLKCSRQADNKTVSWTGSVPICRSLIQTTAQSPQSSAKPSDSTDKDELRSHRMKGNKVWGFWEKPGASNEYGLKDLQGKICAVIPRKKEPILVMDCRTVTKKSRKRRKKNVDNTPQQAEKEPVYFSNDSILEAAKFLNYEKWSQMRFLCHRINQLIHSNQANLQAFEVASLSMSEIWCSGNSIVSFDQAIEPAIAMRKWFQDRGYSCDETTDLPLEKVFAGMNLSRVNGLYLTIRAFYEDSTKKNTPLTRSQAKQLRKKRTGTENRCLSSGMMLRKRAPKLFSAEFNAKYEFYGPILSHFFRLLHHPDAYFREVSMFPPLTDKFCDISSKNLIRCEQFTLHHLDSSLEQSFKWLKDNVRAQNITLSFNYDDAIQDFDLHSLVSEFLLLDASICARDCITLDWLLDPGEFVKNLIQKYESLEITKPIPSILVEDCPSVDEYFESNLVLQEHSTVVGKFCDKCDVKSYELQNKMDGTRKMIAQVKHCIERECVYSNSGVYMRFE
ncbi:nidogen-like domain-containing protein [Ditylenchus destructor]|nr:nidogen-like domain-containing protein [Ditylenchus destructor]